jgi:hypothetical protein
MNIISKVLTQIGRDYKENIRNDSHFYLEVDIARKAAELGFSDVEDRYRNVYAIVPLKQPVNGMKVRIDSRTFVNYAQFEFGIVVPDYVAREVDMPHKAYVAKDSMICNYT